MSPERKSRPPLGGRVRPRGSGRHLAEAQGLRQRPQQEGDDASASGSPERIHGDRPEAGLAVRGNPGRPHVGKEGDHIKVAFGIMKYI